MASAPYDTRSQRLYGLRGRYLARKREERRIGQVHQAKALGMSQPDLSRIEREVFGGVPRGFSSRYLDALDAIAAGGSAHFDRCGCRP